MVNIKQMYYNTQCNLDSWTVPRLEIEPGTLLSVSCYTHYLVACIILNIQPAASCSSFWQQVMCMFFMLYLECLCFGNKYIKYLNVCLRFVSNCYTQTSRNKDLIFWGNHSSIISPFHTDITNIIPNHMSN